MNIKLALTMHRSHRPRGERWTPVAFDHGSETDDALLEVEERLSALSLAAAALEPICAVIALFRSAATRSGRTTFLVLVKS